MFAFRCLIAMLLTVATSCAHQPAEDPAGGRVSRDANIITRAELDAPAVAGRDANFAIQQLRPAFFRSRGAQTLGRTDASSAPGSVSVSEDFGPLRAASVLSGITTRNLFEIRYLDAVAAQARFGINANGGPVIVLVSARK